MIYIIKGLQFIPMRHLNQNRKRLLNDADSGPPEEKEVMDAIYNTFDKPIPPTAPEQHNLKRKMTDFIVINLKRKRYWDSCRVNT